MKKISLILSMAFFLNANCQNLAKKLQEKTWLVTGDLLKSEKCVLSANNSQTKTPVVKFFADGKMQIPYEEDFKFTCPYELNKDMIKIYYTINHQKEKKQEKENVAHYYRIKELLNQKDFEFTPISAADFK
jgi:hypothetical protein